MFRSYLRLVLFAVGLLLGVQVPGFLTDYAQRVEAHRLESQRALAGFQNTANQFFNGDLQALVAHYRASEDPVIRNDAQSVALLVDRQALLEREWQAMQGAWYQRAWHVAVHAERDLLLETYDGYRYQVLLSPEAIAWGVACGLLVAWVVEGLLVALSMPFMPRHSVARRWR